MSGEITVLLTLKGRPLHTLRWMWHHNRIGLPFKVVVADGGEDPEVEALLSETRNFPNLDYRYLRYHDVVLSDYWFKLSDVIRKIDSDYVVMSDNDDFVLPKAVAKYGQFLDANPDYVAAGGHMAGFSINGSAGPLNNIAGAPYFMRLVTNPQQFDESSAVARLSKTYGSSINFYYNLTRTGCMKDVFDGYRSLDLNNLDVSEHFHDSFILTLGKVKFFQNIAYMRQYGSSVTYAGMKPIFDRIMFGNWLGEVETSAAYCANHAGAGDQGPSTEIAAQILSHFHSHFRTRLAVATASDVSPEENLASRLRNALKGVPAICLARYRRKLAGEMARMRRGGMTSADEATLLADFNDVTETLAGPGFPAYFAALQAEGRVP